MDTLVENTTNLIEEESPDIKTELERLRKQNEELKKDLENSLKENSRIQELEDELDCKEKEILLLQLELEELRKEKEDLQAKVSMVPKKFKFEPVANPLQTALINSLVDASIIKTKEIEEIMKSIDRGDFVRNQPYSDRPQPIGYNTTISAPHMHAAQLELFRDTFKNSRKALDIGTGSGFVALCLAKMMIDKEDAKTYALDHIPQIVEMAKTNISKNHKNYIDEGKIEFVVADGRKGLPEHAPYDIIFVGGAVEEIPDCLIDQLAPGGTMLIPVGSPTQQLTIIHRNKNEIIEKPVMSVMFGRLQSPKEQCPDLIF